MPDYQTFTTRECDGVHIITLTNVAADREIVNQVGTELMAYAQEEKPQRLAVSFRSVSRLSAPAVGKLLVFIKTIKANGGCVECCEAPEGFGELLGVIGRSLPFDHLSKSEAEVVEILKGM